MGLTIHHLHVSQSERIVWLCEELDVPYSLKDYTRAPLLSPPELAALTSQKSAPVLTTANPTTGVQFNMSESAAIAEYINTVHGGGKLALKPDHENYPDYLFWFHFANGTLQPAFMRKLSLQLLGAPMDTPIAQSLAGGAQKALANINARLETTGAYLAGEDLTLADIMSVWTLGTQRQWGPMDLSDYPAILACLQRIGEKTRYGRGMEKAEPAYDWKKNLTKEGPEMFGPLKDLIEPMKQ
jgi:glutathione S-transferase